MNANMALVGLAAALALLGSAGRAAAEGEAVAQGAPAQVALDPKLEAQLAAEKESRKQCKMEICKLFAARPAQAAPIACDVVKTFLSDEISQRILSGRIGWPWGHAHCSTHLDLDGAALVKLISQPEFTEKFRAHELKCTVESAKAGEKGAAEAFAVKVSVAPEVTFKQGKATNVKLNWSNIDAPMLAKGAIWSATTLDSAMNVMGGSAAGAINDLIYGRCKEVGVDIAQPQ